MKTAMPPIFTDWWHFSNLDKINKLTNNIYIKNQLYKYSV